MSRTAVETTTHTLGGLNLRGSREPLKRNGALDRYASFEVTPTIGQEFSGEDVQLSEILKAPNADELVKDLAILGPFPFTVGRS